MTSTIATARMRALAVLGFVFLANAPVFAQDPPPRIPWFVVDVHATVPHFPDSPILAESRNLTIAELPGRGLGAQLGVHLYPIRWRAITFGIGGEVAGSRSRFTPPADSPASLNANEEKFLTAAPQLSFNFGNAHGWSYLSGGIGLSQWSLIPEGRDPYPGDSERLETINYGGGARWFAKTHLAFSFDVRFYAINPGSPYLGHSGSPRTTLVIIGAGISVK
jgi:hypothetical protein